MPLKATVFFYLLFLKHEKDAKFEAIKNQYLTYEDPLEILDTLNKDGLFKCLITCTKNSKCVMVKFKQNQCRLFRLIQTQYLSSSNSTVLYQLQLNNNAYVVL